MKRFLLILLALSLLLGCKAGEKDAANTPKTGTTSIATPEPEPETTPAAEAAPVPDDGCPLPTSETEDEPEQTALTPHTPEPEDPANDARGFFAENQELLERAAEEMRGKKMSVFAGIMTGWNEGWNQWEEIINYDLSEDLQAFRTLSEQWQFSAEWTEDGACFVIALPENGDASHAAYEVRLLYAENAPEQADESLAEHWYLRMVPFYDISGEKSLYDIWKAGKDFIELFPVGRARYVEKDDGISHWMFERFTVTENGITFEDSVYGDWYSRTLISATYDAATDTLHIVCSDGSTAEATRAEGYHPYWNDTGVAYQQFPVAPREKLRTQALELVSENRERIELAASDMRDLPYRFFAGEVWELDEAFSRYAQIEPDAMTQDMQALFVLSEEKGFSAYWCDPEPEFAEGAEPYFAIGMPTTIDVSDLSDIYPGSLYWVSLIYTMNTEDQIEDTYYRHVMEPIGEHWFIEITDNAF